MIRFLVVASGSHGNATLIYDEHTLFQIDMGISLKRVKEGVKSIGRNLEDIKAIFITHEHSDHISTLSYLPTSIKRYASPNTLENNPSPMKVGSSVSLGDFTITSFSVSHDAVNPVGYLIINGDDSLFYLTDSGFLPESVILLMENKTYYIIESNHDLKMLKDSSRPAMLKKRIKSNLGHLSNLASARYMASAIGDKTKEIVLAHLSEECNTPELALETYQKVFHEKSKSLDGIILRCANQHASLLGGAK
jgi:phosphoribosyl 1,2-cyclic phosphodiesterase